MAGPVVQYDRLRGDECGDADDIVANSVADGGGRDAPQSFAVYGEQLCLAYKKGTNRVVVLDGLSISVPSKCIYSLLGPSGCGKTTLLRCILGRLLPDSGQLEVLGKAPRSPGHNVPGKAVGYMPQELALAPDFTIFETMRYFGFLHRMNEREVRQRTEFLSRLLDLPPSKRLVKQLSGGQQRRVSFAVALLHKPIFLILDEPTVGVDPVLRARIWKHLREIVSGSDTSIIITTHYIEEARQADMVAMMRSGRLLAEDEPSALLQYYSVDTLEEVFLLLCQDEGVPDRTGNSSVNEAVVSFNESKSFRHQSTDTFSKSSRHELGRSPDSVSCAQQLRHALPTVRLRNMSALVWKGFCARRRNPGFLAFEFLLPSIQIILFCLAIGQVPTGLKLAVVDSDQGCFVEGVALPKFSLNYTLCLEGQHGTILVDYPSSSSALRSVQRGDTFGMIEFSSNFTCAFLDRAEHPYNGSNRTIEDSTIHVRLDTTDQQISLVLQEDIAQAYSCFLNKLLTNYGWAIDLVEHVRVNQLTFSSPLQFEKPVYGKPTARYTDFVTPGIIVLISYGMSIGLTALAVLTERKQGLLDRSWAAGVSVAEVLFGLFTTQFIVLLGQALLMLILAVLAFKVELLGSVVLVFIVVILQGLAGMAYGLVISAFSDDEMTAIQLAMGSFYPVMLLSGVIWPVQGMPRWLQYVSSALPNTAAAEALRSIMLKGWSFVYPAVWRGVLITIGWLSFFILLAGIGLRRKK